jgi:hypothetical protein
VGAFGLVVCIARGLRLVRALRWGDVALARWLEATRTRTEIEGRPLMRHRFAFTTARGQECVVECVSADDRHLRDDRDEVVFSDPAEPQSAVALGSIPGDPRPTSDDGFHDKGSGARGVLALTTVSALAWLVVAVIWLERLARGGLLDALAAGLP